MNKKIQQNPIFFVGSTPFNFPQSNSKNKIHIIQQIMTSYENSFKILKVTYSMSKIVVSHENMHFFIKRYLTTFQSGSGV